MSTEKILIWGESKKKLFKLFLGVELRKDQLENSHKA